MDLVSLVLAFVSVVTYGRVMRISSGLRSRNDRKGPARQQNNVLRGESGSLLIRLLFMALDVALRVIWLT